MSADLRRGGLIREARRRRECAEEGEVGGRREEDVLRRRKNTEGGGLGTWARVGGEGYWVSCTYHVSESCCVPEPSGDGTWVSSVVPSGGLNSYSYSYIELSTMDQIEPLMVQNSYFLRRTRGFVGQDSTAEASARDRGAFWRF